MALSRDRGPSIFWDWRGEIRVLHQKGTDGTCRRQSKPVRSRMAKGGDLSHLDFDAAKQCVYDELEQQLAQAGEIGDTSESLSADSQS